MAECQEVMVWVGMKKLNDDEGILIGADGPQYYVFHRHFYNVEQLEGIVDSGTKYIIY